MNISTLGRILLTAVCASFLLMSPAMSQEKPNVLVIWGDDIGWYNLSVYNHGVMGNKTPNIDRIAKEGMLFTDAYGQQSCGQGQDRLGHLRRRYGRA
jgi:hypothetical protein